MNIEFGKIVTLLQPLNHLGGTNQGSRVAIDLCMCWKEHENRKINILIFSFSFSFHVCILRSRMDGVYMGD